MSKMLYLKDCCHCKHEGEIKSECEWCGGKGEVLISLSEINRQIQIENAKLKYFTENPDEHFNSCIDYYTAYGEDDELTYEGKQRTLNSVLTDITDATTNIVKLKHLLDFLNRDYMLELAKIYKVEQTTSDLCNRCDNKGYICRGCDNFPENVFEMLPQLFKAKDNEGQQWYEKTGYKLQRY